MNILLLKRTIVAFILPILISMALLPIMAYLIFSKIDFESIESLIEDDYFSTSFISPLFLITIDQEITKPIIVTTAMILIFALAFFFTVTIKNSRWWAWSLYGLCWAIYLFFGSSFMIFNHI